MQPIRWWSGFAALTVFFAQASVFAEDKVEVKVVKYADLTNMVKQVKGKVVVADFWADW
jgi:hypothetical protein